MARMLPKLKENEIDRRIDVDGERLLYRALRDQLPDDWVVRHSYFSCHRYDAGQRLNPREVDFVVLAPGHGVLFLEVKDSYGYECRGARWYRIKRDGRSEEMDKSPFMQVNTAHQHLIQLFCRQRGIKKEDFPGIHGHVVIYPYAPKQSPLPPSQDPMLVITKADMNNLYARLKIAFTDWGAKQRGAHFNGQPFDWLHEEMKDECRGVTVTSSTSAEDNATVEKLTLQQFETFRGLLANTRALVNGRAGSGKTLLAVWAANAIAAGEGNPRVLVLCFNRLLPAWLRLKYPPVDGVDIESYHSLALRYIRLAGIRFDIGEDVEGFFRQRAPQLFEEAIEAIGNSGLYDAVFVDEAHDFEPGWWLSTEMLLRSERASKFFVFYDPDQARIYGDTQREWLPVHFATTFSLERNCRNTIAIAKYAGAVLGKDILTRDDAPAGVPPNIRPTSQTANARAEEVEAILARWMRDEQVKPSQVAILSPFRIDNATNCLHGRPHVAGIKMATQEEDLEEWITGRAVLCTTTKSFKGLEAEYVIVTDVPEIPAQSMSVNEMYVGTTRAKHHLCVIPMNASAHHQLEGWR